MANWRSLLTGSVADGRQLLREVLETPFRFEAEGEVYKFSATVATGRLVAGAIGLRGPHCGASPGGCGVVRSGGGQDLVSSPRERSTIVYTNSDPGRVAARIVACELQRVA